MPPWVPSTATAQPRSQMKVILKRSVWDSVDRSPVQLEDLDLDKSYEDDLKEAIKREGDNQHLKIPAKQTWINPNPGKVPLYDIEQLPEGWHPAEPDLDDDDTVRQIERCYERLDEGIMPHIFESKLERHELALVCKQMLKPREDSALSEAVVQRLESLDDLWESIYKAGDRFEQLVNIEAVMDAYRSGELQWNGLVTYWSFGSQLCQPRPFNWDEFEAINERYEGSMSFWTEGLDGPGDEHWKYCISINPSTIHRFLHVYRVAFRLPNFQYWEEMTMLYDTGATMTRIFWDDVVRLQGEFTTDDHPIPIVGAVRAEEMTSFTDATVIMIEVCLINQAQPNVRETPWIRIQCAVSEGPADPRYPQRLDGPWLRHFIHTATEPDGYNRIRIASNRSELSLIRFGLPHTVDRRLPRIPYYTVERGELEVPPAIRQADFSGNSSEEEEERRAVKRSKKMPEASRRGIEDDVVD
ncbi:hypothetical protein N7494_004976 [Penicillium frequentans]|uniref:Uncharacterized protein n=1 Tax=Penicillium frequentans TaxID=3151616 RepID=A0AAD6D3P4_9EURO|nr:hypothetical protein N7494_004976 [Penicillium glabrum]